VATNTLPTGAVPTFDLDGTNTQNQVTALVLVAGTNRLDANFGYRYASPTLAVLQAGSFLGYITNGAVWLQWHTLSEARTADFIINRQAANGGWEAIGFVLALDSASGAFYHTIDATATTAGAYKYQLVEEQMEGASVVLGYCTIVVGPPIVTIHEEAGNIHLAWQGGTPPYHLEKCSILETKSQLQSLVNPLPATGWVEVPMPDQMTNTILLPKEDSATFFRIRSGQ
jgi:hypothetical protein